DVDVAAGRPAVVGRHPDVVGPDALPVAGLPAPGGAGPHPVAGDVEEVGRGRIAGRGEVGRGRRLGQVGHLLRRVVGPVVGPEAGHPLDAVAGLPPVAGHPALALRRRPPDAADPEEVLALVVVVPVAADPDHVALGLLLRRQLLEVLRRSFGDDGRRLRVAGEAGEGLVDGAAGEDLDALGGGRRVPGRGRLGGGGHLPAPGAGARRAGGVQEWGERGGRQRVHWKGPGADTDWVGCRRAAGRPRLPTPARTFGAAGHGGCRLRTGRRSRQAYSRRRRGRQERTG